jgi:predicted nuclease of predicted toxin-antitoxin system
VKFLVDAQLPPALAEWFRARGHEAAAVREVGLREADDQSIWFRAQTDGAIIVRT